MPRAAKPKRSSGPSGPTQTDAERKAAGRVLVRGWISGEAADRLDELAAAWGVTRTHALERIIRERMGKAA